MRRGFLLFITSLLTGAIISASGTLVVSDSGKASAESTVVASTPLPTQSPSVSPSPSVVTAAAHKPQTATVPTLSGNSLSIPSIGLLAPIIDVGVTADNAIDVPAGKQVGLYTGDARPGSLGAVFLDGHVEGVFARLATVSEGQVLNVNYGGQSYSYRVVHTEVVLLAGIDMNRALMVYGGGNEGLNIMTCAGTYMPSQGTYDQRLVVYTVRI